MQYRIRRPAQVGKNCNYIMTAREIKEKINELKGQLALLEAKEVRANTAILVSELLNLRDGVGEGYREEDYYAPERYYSKVKGVKNFFIESFDNDTKTYKVIVKVVSQSGFLLPAEVDIEGDKFELLFVRSKKYDHNCDY